MIKKHTYGLVIIACIFLPFWIYASTLIYSNLSNPANDWDAGTAYGYTFTSTATDIPDTASVLVFDRSSGTNGNATITLYTYVSGNPDSGTPICSGISNTATWDTSNTTTTFQNVSLTGCSTITSGNTYAIVITSANNFNNGIGWRQFDGGTGSYTYSGGSWSARGAGQESKLELSSTGSGGGGTGTSTPLAIYSSATTTDQILRTVAFGEGILIFFGFLAFMGFIWNRIDSKKKKSWQK